MQMIFDECIISKYGKTCISNIRLPLNNLIMYLIIRTTENIIKKYISNIKFNYEDLDTYYISFT